MRGYPFAGRITRSFDTRYKGAWTFLSETKPAPTPKGPVQLAVKPGVPKSRFLIAEVSHMPAGLSICSVGAVSDRNVQAPLSGRSGWLSRARGVAAARPSLGVQ
jgi:hypothetical protein